MKLKETPSGVGLAPCQVYDVRSFGGICSPTSTRVCFDVGHGWQPIHHGLNRDGGQIVSWVEPVVAGDTELLLRTNSNCETLEPNEMMSNVQTRL